MVRLKNKSELNYSTFSNLKDGQLAVVIDINYNGRIVQRHGDDLITIGSGHGCRWTGGSGALKLKPLKNGTELIIEDNE